jgi:hypothetical protein
MMSKTDFLTRFAARSTFAVGMFAIINAKAGSCADMKVFVGESVAYS